MNVEKTIEFLIQNQAAHDERMTRLENLVGTLGSVVGTLADKVNHLDDVMATLSPAVEGWFRTPRMRLTGRSQLDMFYYRELTSLRAVDSNHSGRLDVTVNRLTPWVTGNVAVTRHSQNFEIDAIVKQRNDGFRVGTDVRLTGDQKASFGGSCPAGKFRTY
jgi:hypothetical protein